MERLRQRVSIAPSGTDLNAPDCALCSDTGMAVGKDGARRCECVQKAARRRFYRGVPKEFRATTLQTAQPDPSRHPNQAKTLAMLRDDPFGSYLFFGANGVGKSFFAWLLLMNAYEDGRHTVAIELDQLLKQYRRHEFNDAEMPAVLADDLRPGPAHIEQLRKDFTVAERIAIEPKKSTIFLDEISATSPTEYAAKEFFHLLKSAHEFEHQVVMTCNVTPQQLHAHWSRVDSFWGNSIARRIAEYMTLVDLTK